jgi:hypothetical protein
MKNVQIRHHTAGSGDQDVQVRQVVDVEVVEEHGPRDGLQDVVGEQHQDQVERHKGDAPAFTVADIEHAAPELANSAQV